jgi:hypothetical protein
MRRRQPRKRPRRGRLSIAVGTPQAHLRMNGHRQWNAPPKGYGFLRPSGSKPASWSGRACSGMGRAPTPTPTPEPSGDDDDQGGGSGGGEVTPWMRRRSTRWRTSSRSLRRWCRRSRSKEFRRSAQRDASLSKNKGMGCADGRGLFCRIKKVKFLWFFARLLVPLHANP